MEDYKELIVALCKEHGIQYFDTMIDKEHHLIAIFPSGEDIAQTKYCSRRAWIDGADHLNYKAFYNDLKKTVNSLYNDEQKSEESI